MTIDSIKRTKLTLASVYFTFFIDNLSWSIVFPIFAPYFLDPKNHLFSPDVLIGTRTTILGIFLMAFSFGQFLGAPMIGEYGDIHGRRKALIVSVFFTFVGLALSAWSMAIESLILLFIGRLITGLFAGNLSVCLACVSDLSDNYTKAKNFGMLSVMAGLSFIIGAFLGGKLSDPTINPIFSPTLPLWIATAFTAINFLFVLLAFRETSTINPTIPFCFFEAFRNIKMALKTEKIKTIYSIYFLFIFSWTILFQFSPVLAVEKFYFTSSNVGDLALYLGICWAIGSGYLSKILLQYFDLIRILEFSLFGFTVLCGMVIFFNHIYGFFGILGLCVMIGGLSWPLCTALISNLAPRDMQGKILGISQSIQSFSMSIAPLVGGFAFHYSMSLPFLIGAVTCLGAGILYFILKDR